MFGFISLFVALVTVAVGVYHYKNYPKKYTITSKFEKYWPMRLHRPHPAGAGLGVIFVFILFFSAYLLYLDIAIGIGFCLLILFIDYRIFTKIRKCKKVQ